MVAVLNMSKRKAKGEQSFSTRAVLMASSAVVAVLALVESVALWDDNRRKALTLPLVTFNQVDVQSISSLRNAHLRHEGEHHADDQQCRWYLAESAIPHSGLGLFSGTGVLPGEMVGFPDICIFVSDAPKHWTHLRSHSYGRSSFYGQYEGSNSRAACEGFSTTYNTQPNRLVNTEIVSPVLPTNAGLNRDKNPGAGSITHHFGIHAKAKDIITAGSELIIEYVQSSAFSRRLCPSYL
jgi:hypothetical protein